MRPPELQNDPCDQAGMLCTIAPLAGHKVPVGANVPLGGQVHRAHKRGMFMKVLIE